MEYNELIMLIFEAIIYGFCFTSFIVIILSFFKSQKFKRLKENYFCYAIKVIRIIGLVYFLYYIIYSLYFYNIIMTEEDALSTRNRATGPYAWAYWMMLLRPVFIGLTTQLFWINKLSKKGVLRGLIILIIFLALLMTGANLERYIIAITSIHRDYPNIEWQLNDTWLMLIPLILFIVFERIFIFTFLILILWFLNKQNKKQLLYNLVNLKHFILFWITALLILIVGIPPTFESNALDINIHDTYYVIAGLQVTFVIAIIYAFIGLVYWITYKMELSLNNTLTKIHIIISIGLFFIYQIGILLLTRDEFPLFDMYTSLNTLTTTVLISVIVAQSFFIVNLFISFYKHGIQRTTSR